MSGTQRVGRLPFAGRAACGTAPSKGRGDQPCRQTKNTAFQNHCTSLLRPDTREHKTCGKRV
eukprot:2764894-Amphidinium_carterae.1